MRRAWLLALLWIPAQANALGGDYPVLPVPAGDMAYELPLNIYLNTDYISIPVRIPGGLSIGKHEVTRALWQACHKAGACAKPGLPKDGAGPGHPMVDVNWHEAREFTRWYSRRTGRRWRLPTEHEWFYVASLGRGWKSEEKQYDYSDIEKVRALPKQTYAAGKFGENAWGVADLAGNVWEWTLGCYSLAPEKMKRPQAAGALDDPQACTSRVAGGEHRAGVPDFISDSYQGGCSTLKPTANLGFRMVLEP